MRRAITRAEGIKSPVVWVRELRILRRLLPGKDDVGIDYEVRRVRLKQGLNIIWAPPEDATKPAALYEDGIAGHASGKTTFCRVIRFVLGEGNFGTDALRESVRGTFAEIWALAEVLIGTDCWLVGRALVPSLHHFALKNWELDSFLAQQPLQPRGSYEQFVETLETACCQSLPTDGRYAWRQMLPWLARDQECRFAAIHLWRNSSLSEAEAPETNIADQHLLMRAVLRLLESREHDARVLVETSFKEIEKIEADGRIARAKLEEDVSRLDSDLASLKDDDTALEAKRKLLAGAGEMIAEQLEKIGDDPELTRAEQEVLRLSNLQSGLTSDVAALKNAAADTEKDIETTRNDIQRLKDQSRENPSRAADGCCPHKWETAVARGCVEAQEKLFSAAEPPEKALDLQLGRFQQRLAKHSLDLSEKSKRLVQVTRELVDAEGVKKTAGSSRKIRLAPTRKQLLTNAARVERISNVQLSRAALKTLTDDLAKAKEKLEKQRIDAIEERKSAAPGVDRFSEIFGDIVRAVMGPRVSAQATVTEKGLTLQVKRNAELQGSALATIRVLAFDLAALVQSIEGAGFHPRFLIHDGPRESDLSRVIYERFFLYARRMEEETASGEEFPFQYILTTTTPPPVDMSEEGKWVRLTLDASVTSDRFFREDL